MIFARSSKLTLICYKGSKKKIPKNKGSYLKPAKALLVILIFGIKERSGTYSTKGKFYFPYKVETWFPLTVKISSIMCDLFFTIKRRSTI